MGRWRTGQERRIAGREKMEDETGKRRIVGRRKVAEETERKYIGCDVMAIKMSGYCLGELFGYEE